MLSEKFIGTFEQSKSTQEIITEVELSVLTPAALTLERWITQYAMNYDAKMLCNVDPDLPILSDFDFRRRYFSCAVEWKRKKHQKLLANRMRTRLFKRISESTSWKIIPFKSSPVLIHRWNDLLGLISLTINDKDSDISLWFRLFYDGLIR